MLQSLEVRNFQSISHITLELGGLTVVVGQSSSGKSAVVRAMKMLTSNARGTSFIRHGETVCTVTAVTDRGTVTLRKGKEDSYVVVPHPNDQTSGIEHPELSRQRTYSKLNAAVPEEVTEFLGIPAKDAINFAGQFDGPYLLTSKDYSGTEVARVLGELTNVTWVFEAARETRRQELAANATLKTRRFDLATEEARVDDFRDLKPQLAALTKAEELIATAGTIEKQLARVDALANTLDVLQELIDTHSDLPKVPDIQRVRTARAVSAHLDRLNSLVGSLKPIPVVPPAPPSTTEARAVHGRLSRLLALVDDLSAASTAVKMTTESIEASNKILSETVVERLTILHEAGTCPTCKQSTKHLEHA